MKINAIERIDDDGGDFLLLVDYGVEGMSVASQHETLPEAVCAMANTPSGPHAIVRLCDTKEIDHE